MSSVKLRQNPHSVHEWLNRVKIYHEEPERVHNTTHNNIHTHATARRDKEMPSPSLLVCLSVCLSVCVCVQVIRAYTEAVMTIDPQRAVGKLHLLWIRFAGYYETHDDLDNARVILEKATHVNFRGVDDLATIWCHWAEMEIKHKHFDKALEVHTYGREWMDGWTDRCMLCVACVCFRWRVRPSIGPAMRRRILCRPGCTDPSRCGHCAPTW